MDPTFQFTTLQNLPPVETEDTFEASDEGLLGDDGMYWPAPAVGFLDSPTGVAVGEREALACAAAVACTRAISETLASLPSVVIEKRDRGKTRESAFDSKAWKVLVGEPCPAMGSMTFWDMACMRVVNRGNSFNEIERNRAGEPIAIWPIHNSRVSPRRESDGRYVFDVSTDEPGAEHGNRHVYRSYTLEQSEIFNIVGFGSENGIQAPGVIPYAREEIALNIASQTYGGRFFKQGGKPAGIVEHPDFIASEKKRRLFREDMNRIHSGVENWHKVGVLWGGAKWREIGVEPEKAQLLETRKFSEKAICRFYGVPPAIVQIFDDYKFSTVDAMIRQFTILTLRNYCVRIERAVREQLTQGRGEDGFLEPIYKNEELFFEFVLDALVRGDPKLHAETNKVKIESGVLNQDDARSEDNRNPLPNGQGQKYWMPVNVQPIDQRESTPQGAATSDSAVVAEKANEILQLLRTSACEVKENNEKRFQTAVSVHRGFARRVVMDAFARMANVEAKEWARQKGKDNRIEKLRAFYARHVDRFSQAIQIGFEELGLGQELFAKTWCDAQAGRAVHSEDYNPEAAQEAFETLLGRILE